MEYLLGVWLKPDHWDAVAFEQLIVGAGGTRTDLVALVLSHIEHIVPNPTAPITEQTMVHVRSFFLVVAGQGVLGGAHPDLLFQTALLSNGIVTTLTTVSRTLSRSSVAEERTAAGLISTLVEYISVFPARWLPQSLRAGLLEILFNPEHRQVTSARIVRLLGNIILPATVSHSVLVHL